MVIERTTTKRYEITLMQDEPFMKFGKFIETRKRIGLKTTMFERCFVCKMAFLDDDDVFIASVTPKVGNRFICAKCRRAALEDE
jgi:hypothetical protein